MLSLRRCRTPDVRVISTRPQTMAGSPSFVLHTRREDDGAMWPALAARRRRALPQDLQWAAPLLDATAPLPVLCGESQVAELYHWLDALPNTERVSIVCQRQPPGTCSKARPAPGGRAATPRPTTTRQEEFE
jgi:hypothetical protein